MEFTLFTKLAKLPFITALTMLVAALIVVGGILLILRANKQKEAMEEQKAGGTRALVYGALCVALSFVLSYLKLFSMPQGGSITLCGILPVAMYANWYGVKKGLLAGLALGILQFIQEPIAVHWAQPVLDYLLAFACIGFAGYFKESQLPLGILAGGIGRILCSTVSGAIFFAEYAPPTMNPWIYSTIYNTISLGPDALICIIVALLPPFRKAAKTVAPFSA